VRHYGRHSANVGLFARRRSVLDALTAELPAGHAVAYEGDVRDAQSLVRAAADFIARFGPPDVVIANAGVSRGTLTEHAEDAAVFREVMDVNVLGMVHTFAPFIASMRAARHGTLAGIASVAGFRGLPGAGAYSASKAAAIAYLESLRLELRGTGIAVVTICPGYIATPMTASNPYPMPFLMKVEPAASLIARAIAHRRRFYVLPRQMAAAGWMLKRLPRPLYDRLFANAPRKPRSTR
jgi:NAD(P)-dependent dehydrogenase (short-subunit alcohol dehydrogenase family)